MPKFKKEIKKEAPLEKARRVKAENLAKRKEAEKTDLVNKNIPSTEADLVNTENNIINPVDKKKIKAPKTSPQGMAEYLKDVYLEIGTLAFILRDIKTYKFNFDNEVTVAITKLDVSQELVFKCITALQEANPDIDFKTGEITKEEKEDVTKTI